MLLLLLFEWRMANGEWRMDQKIAVVATPDVIFRIQVIQGIYID